VKTAAGPQWITIPVLTSGVHSQKRPIHSIETCWEKMWNKRHLTQLEAAYGGAPFFEKYAPLLRRWYGECPRLLADFTIQQTIDIARELGIESTRFLRSSTFPAEGTKTQRLVSILKHVGANRYFSGPSAKDYIDEALLQANGIALDWMDYNYPEYPQFHPPFDPRLSILDLLMMTGEEAPRYIWAC
jgi:hypothetical protein